MASASLPYQVVTDRIIEKLEQGTVPWRQPWSTELPKSLTTKKDYRGINVFLLGSQGYTNPYWLTFKQGKRLGGHIRRGEKATPIVFWKWIERETEEVDEAGKRVLTSAPMLRYYYVFNLEQCEGIEIPEFKTHQTEPIPRSESIVASMPNCPVVEHKESRAFYRPLTDTVNMPALDHFSIGEEYYSTLFHELTHATGHSSRLDRQDMDKQRLFGSLDYSQEELVAEMGAAFLCGNSGIVNRTIDNSTAYIQGWLKRLRNDKRLLVFAGGQAQKAADYILASNKDN